MDLASIGNLVFLLVLAIPAAGLLLVPFIDIRYGNIFLMGAFFEGLIYREDKPLLFWSVVLFEFLTAICVLSRFLPDIMAIISRMIG